MEQRLAKDWLRLTVWGWIVASAWLLWQKRQAIYWFALPDTDDNLRIAQVRALLQGQGWYDLRQYRLSPPAGFDIHWSRLVDLPIAGLELLFRPFVGGHIAEVMASAVAPLLPLLVAMLALGFIVRRLVDPRVALVAAALLVMACASTLSMMMPMRIDHHGWQLALLAVGLAGVVDDDRRRGGLTTGIATALSVTIGLELMPYLALTGAALALRWALDPRDGLRLRAYGAALAMGVGVGFALFASIANRAPRCDVLSPVWLTMLALAGVAAVLLSFVRSEARPLRLGLLAVAGAALAAVFALGFPQCLGRPEQISPQLYDRWFSLIREAKPLTQSDPQIIVMMVTLPLFGIAGSVWMLRRHWRDALAPAWAQLVMVSAVSLGLLLWQVRAGPAAQLVAVPGVVALIALIVPPLRASSSVLVRTLGVAGAVIVVSGAGAANLADRFLTPKPGKVDQRIKAADRRCPTMPALAPVARLPRTTVFTMVDLGPRLIAVTHHSAIAGPYHRNGDAILSVQGAFEGSPENARATMQRTGATLLLICPHFSESTVYRSRAPKGFYAQLEAGKAFDWLQPLPLPSQSPYRLYRIAPR